MQWVIYIYCLIFSFGTLNTASKVIITMNPNTVLAKYLGIPFKDFPKEMIKFIQCKVKKVPEWTKYTYTVGVKGKKMSEDAIYAEHEWLLQHIPRGFTLFVPEGSDIIIHLSGPLKFSGENPEVNEDEMDGAASGIFNLGKVLGWKKSGVLRITRLTKANGKFAIVRVFAYNGVVYIFGGSKNCHNVCEFTQEAMEKSITEWHAAGFKLVADIFGCFLKQFEELKALYDAGRFEECSLVGEYCDGLHLTPLDDGDVAHIEWFSLFGSGGVIPGGKVMDVIYTLWDVGLRTVDFETVKGSVEDALRLARCGLDEGNVLYFENTETSEVQLCKSKAVFYILCRMFRQILTKGARTWHAFVRRVWETMDYHFLSLDALEKVFPFFWDFLRWMYAKGFPFEALEFMDSANSSRGEIGMTGFGNFMKVFMSETGKTLVFVPEDFRSEDEKVRFSDYRKKVAFVERTSEEVGVDKMPIVVFTQALQGSGKSTIAASVCRMLCMLGVKACITEQDWHYGCTKTCRAYLRHCITEQDFDVIFVSRCNINAGQYGAYLNICHSVGARVVFMTPRHHNCGLAVAVALAGIYNRSEEGDRLIAGRVAHPKQSVLEFMSNFAKDYEKHAQAVEFSLYTPEFEEMMEEFGHNDFNMEEIDAAVTEHGVQHFMNFRRSVDDIAYDIVQKLLHGLTADDMVVCPKTSMVAFYVRNEDREMLLDLVKKQSGNGTLVCEHVTQIYYGGKNVEMTPVPSGKIVHAHICALVSGPKGALAFDVDRLEVDGMEVFVNSRKPHITAWYPKGMQASDSVKFVKETEGVERQELDITLALNCVHVPQLTYGKK